MKHIFILLTVIGMMIPVRMLACTSFIISSKASADGRPLMWKHRDTGTLDNRLEHFKGEKYSFVGLVNSSEGPLGTEVWIGSNTAGFSIMNTASYCLKDDDVPASEMDREGVLMHRALEICATLADFEHFLDTLSRPMGVEANFGCIDARGGAAYYETSNDGYVKRDVNAMPDGYCVVTNFSVTGRKEDWKGVERFRTASAIMKRQNIRDGRLERMDPGIDMDSLSSSYEHQGDSLYIPRYITSASVVIEGVREGESADRQVLWAAIGYPDCAVMVPVPVSEEDHIPHYLKKTADSENCLLCDLSLEIKKRDIFPDGRDGGVHIEAGLPARGFMRKAESRIFHEFKGLYASYVSGKTSYEAYLRRYDKCSERYLKYITGNIRHYEDFM